jgi:precorrin-6A/cobalt-precorrin-6A reductase
MASQGGFMLVSPMNVLILGGTTEASAIAAALAGDARVRPVLSLAGRTRTPVLPAVPGRRGGFGGAEGLAAYLRAHGVAALIDATHPFAAQISRNARTAAHRAGVPMVAVSRPPWVARPGDCWTEVTDMRAAAQALGAVPRRVFLTVGQLELAPFRLAPWHRYLIRSVEPPDPALLPPTARCITARGPFREDAERGLLEQEGIEVLVTKNSGGAATAPKLAAARALGIPVVMVARPIVPLGETVPDAAGALAWLDHVAAPWNRGV